MSVCDQSVCKYFPHVHNVDNYEKNGEQEIFQSYAKSLSMNFMQMYHPWLSINQFVAYDFFHVTFWLKYICINVAQSAYFV